MSTETISPLSPSPESSTNNAPQQPGFFEQVFDNQSTSEAKRKGFEKKPVVEHLDPQFVHVYGNVNLEHVQLAREALAKHDEDPTEFPADESLLLEELAAGLNPESPAHDRHVHELHELLTLPDAKFAKKSRSLEMSQARRDGVKLARSKPAKSAEGESEAETSEPGTGNRLTTKARERATERRLRREVRALDSTFEGLVGEIADTGTKTSFLQTKQAEFAQRMEAHGANVNKKTRRSIERETVRKLLDGNYLADQKGLTGDARQDYIEGLVDTFHDYVTLSDEDRAGFDENLTARYEAAGALSRREAARSDVEAEPTESLRSRMARRVGAFATNLMSSSKDRWEARKASKEDEQPALFDEKPYRKKDKLASVLSAPGAAYNYAFTNLQAARAERSMKRQEALSAMNDDERAEYDEKHRRRNKALLIGGAAVAVVGAGLAMKYGYDYLTNDGPNTYNGEAGTDIFGDKLMPDVDGDGIPDSLDIDSGNPPTGDGEALTRNELFDGSGGNRSLTSANIAELRDFMDDYTVDAGDDRGVWGISEKYLESQGIDNPTVFETDAVKDYILSHSNLTDRSIIYPGDTIKLK